MVSSLSRTCSQKRKKGLERCRRATCSSRQPFQERTSGRIFSQPYLAQVNSAASVRANTTQTVKDFIEFVYFPNVQKRPSTINGYRHTFTKHVKTRLGDKRVWDFRPVEGQTILDAITAANPQLTHTTHHWHLHVCVQRGLRDTNPMR